MPQKSRIEVELSDQKLAEFNRLLASGRLTIDGLHTWLEGEGYDISRSSVGRYAQSFERTAERLRESRRVTDALVKDLGEAAIQGQQGRLLVEMARSLVFDLICKMQDDGSEIDTKDVAQLGKGLSELAKAQRYDQDFEEKIIERVKADLAKKLEGAEAEAKAAGDKGLSAERLAQMRMDFLGIRPKEVRNED